MSKNTVQENINRAIQIHVENAVKGLQFNKTELVEIADITNRDKGEYVVFNGSIKYYAYSENTKYALRDKVYVNIPNNDYSQQKIIVGKYKVGGDKISYISPWDNFTPMTKNINSDKNIHKISSAKNGPITVLEIPISENQTFPSKYNGYEYMGVKAYFNARFPGANSGNYGIEIALTYKDPQVPGREVKTKTNYYILDTNSMIGNIYNFPSFYNQEAVFKIPKDIQIIKIVANFFCNESLLEYGTVSMRNLDIRFGNEKTTEMDSLELYCEQGAEYNSSLGDQNSENEKILKIKWCHYDKDEEQLKEIDKKTTSLNSGEAVNLFYNIKWYHKLIKKVDGSDTNDETNNNFEKDWEDITSSSEDLFSIVINPTVLQKEDSFKVIIEYGPKKNNKINPKSYFYKKLESEVYTFKNTAEIPDYTSFDFANTQIIATDDYEGNYHIYDGKNGKILKRVDASKKRELKLEMFSSYINESYLNGNETVYWVVPKVNTMINFEPYASNLQETSESGNKFKKLNKFINNKNGYYVIKQTNRKDGEEYKYSINYQIKEYYTKQAIKNTVYCFVYKNNQMAQTNLTLTFGQYGTAGTDYTFTLGLGNLYDKDWKNVGPADTIITLNDKQYFREIIFNLFDNNNKEIELSADQKDKIIKEWVTWDTKAKAYIPNSKGTGYYKNAKLAECLKFLIGKDANGKCIRVGVGPTTNKLDISFYKGIILQANLTTTINNKEVITFTQYLPLHFRLPYIFNKKTYEDQILDGSDTIVYPDDGNGKKAIYYKSPFKLIHGSNGNAISSSFNILSTLNNDKSKEYWPIFDKEKKLIPCPLYVDLNNEILYVDVKNTDKTVNKVVYTFPLLIMQNAYEVPAVNKWDGSLTIDTENNQILSAMVGAGKKDADNKFSGVLMGEVKTKGNTLYGLYGYDKGIQSYGFKINGTAFIGKSGVGQISFNGNKGIIGSAAYATSGKGSYIDLTNGSIVLDSTQKKQKSDEWENDGNARITLRTRSDLAPYYFRIEANYNNKLKTLMNVGKDDYYLQTANYEKNKAGTKLDLRNGSLVSYETLTLKGATGSEIRFEGNHKDPNDRTKTVFGSVKIGLSDQDEPYLWLQRGSKKDKEGRDNNYLIRFGSQNAYLQSYDYENGKSGTRLDLNNGSLISYGALTLKGAVGSKINFEGKLNTQPDSTKNEYYDPTGIKLTRNDIVKGIVDIGIEDDDVYFKLGYSRYIAKTKKTEKTNLIEFDSSHAILQSAYYGNTKSGLQIDLNKGELKSNGKLTLKGSAGSILEFRGNHIDPQDSKGKKTVEGLVQMGLDSSDRPYLYLKENNNYLMQFGALNAYLQSYDYKAPTKTTGEYSEKGTRIDLRAGLIVSEKFVLKGGDAHFKGEGEFEGTITATSGKIGGWEINKNSLKAGNIIIDSTGSIKSSGGDNGSWSINNDGSASFSKVTINGGTLQLNGVSYSGGSKTENWFNSNQSGLAGYIDQRIKNFLNANLWKVIHEDKALSVNGDNLINIKNAHFNKLYAGFYSDIKNFTGSPDTKDENKENLPFRIVIGTDDITKKNENKSKSFYDLVEYCIEKYIANTGVGFDGGGYGRGSNAGKKLGDSTWISTNGNQYKSNAKNIYVYKPWANCTWSIWEIVYAMHGIKLNSFWGNAVHWLEKAQTWTRNDIDPNRNASGDILYYKFDTSTNQREMKSRSIIVLSSPDSSTGDPGHIVYVVSVDEKAAAKGDYSSCHFMEGNYLGRWREGVGNPFLYRYSVFKGYIYLGPGHIHTMIAG